MPSPSHNFRYAWAGFRQQFNSRRRMAEIARTLALVVPLTLLIWVYAERAQSVDETAQVMIEVSIPEPLTASVIEPANSPVQINMTGPRIECDKLKSEFTMNQRLNLPLPESYAHADDQTVNLLDLLNNDPTIRTSGVTIDSVNPPFIKVAVDHLLSRSVDLAAPVVPQVTFQHVSFDPPQVTLRGPQGLVNTTIADKPQLLVDLGDLSGIVNTQGTATIEVPVAPPRDPRLSVVPTKVKMTFQVGSRETDYTLPSVAVVVERPIAQDGRFRVKAKRPIVQNVQIHGPVDQVQKFEGDNPVATLTAVLSVTQEDAGKTDVQRDVTFTGLLPGVTVVGGPYTVDFDVLDTTSPTDR